MKYFSAVATSIARMRRLISTYIDGLSDIIQKVLAGYRESVNRHESNFQNLANFSKLEDEAYSARERHIS